MATSVAETLGEIPAPVFIRPYTIQGWRPISVNSQPNVFARNGVTMQATSTQRVQRPSSKAFWAPRLDRHSAHADTISIRNPNPTMRRKLQYVTHRTGT